MVPEGKEGEGGMGRRREVSGCGRWGEFECGVVDWRKGRCGIWGKIFWIWFWRKVMLVLVLCQVCEERKTKVCVVLMWGVCFYFTGMGKGSMTRHFNAVFRGVYHRFFFANFHYFLI